MSLKHIRNYRGFFSDYYLGSIFARAKSRDQKKRISDRQVDFAFMRFRRFRERVEDRDLDANSCREKFIRPLLRDVLGFHLGAGENRIHGLFTSAEAESRGEKPILLAYCGSWDEDLDAGRRASNPMHLIGNALATAGLRYGFLITGERLRLVRIPGEGPRNAYLEADLNGLAEEEDSKSFSAFLRLFSLSTFIQDPEGKIPIDEIEKESRAHAEKVSDDLKTAVFTAAESLISGLIEDGLAKGRIASPLDLDDETLRLYRDAALTCLYRILFILYAEARDPRLENHPIYRESYSAQGLLEEILQQPEFAWPENRSSFWPRLRALFRIYDEGLPRISQWDNIPPRGSDFFSSKTPEGKILEEATLSDKLIARIMLDLATSTPRPGVGRERISFRELDIENLGAVYEGLLEYEPRIARETTLEIRVQGRTYCLSPEDTVRLCQQKSLKLCGNLKLLTGTAAENLHQKTSPEEEINEDSTEEAPAGLLIEIREAVDESSFDSDGEEPDPEGQGEEEEETVEKGAQARIVRRIEPGTFFFVPGPAKKGSGSYYTPRALVRDLVRHTLGPLVKDKSAAEIERLRILDPACGSAHFLVEAMRFLGQALHRAYVKEGNGRPPRDFHSTSGQGWDTDWQATDEEARAANSEARAWCKRRIAERCLFGVDLNPTAVQLARVALWIESVAGDRPLTYFEHHIRCGNSLLGTWLERMDSPPLPSLGRSSGRKKKNPRAEAASRFIYEIQSSEIRYQFGLFQRAVREAVFEAARLRSRIDEINPEDLRREGIEPESVQEQEYKEHLRQQAEKLLETVKLLFDLRSASAFIPQIWTEWDYLCSLISRPEELNRYTRSREWWPAFDEVRKRERFFHWELEFPEVFLIQEPPGFDVVLGNPPWEKIKPDRKEFYGRYDVLIRVFKGGELDRRITELQANDPSIASAFKAYEQRLKTTALLLKKGGDFSFQDWVVDGKSTGGDPDLFKFFIEQAWKLVAREGRVGFVVPSAIYNNEGCTGLRHLLLEEAQIERFYGFENRKKIFPIHSSYKFVSLVFRKTRPEGTAFRAAFMRHDLEELEETALWPEPGKEFAFPGPIPWMVSIRKEELERLSPGTLAFLEYRNPRDREILLKMYGYDADGNPVNPRPLLGDQGAGTWNARFYTEFHMTNDRDLWTDPKTGKLWNPRQILGAVSGTTDRPPYYDPAAWPEIRARMAEKGFWPLYEGKHIEQFLIDIRPIERWVNLEAAEKKNGRLPDPGPKLVFRAIASNTNERTCISAVLPEKSCFGNSCWGTILAEYHAQVLCAILNSIPNDFSVRFRVSANMNFTHAGRMAVLDPSVSLSLPIFYTRSVYNSIIENIYEDSQFFENIWVLNRAIAEAYGLTPDDFEYILSTFPVFARKRPEFFAYLKQRVAEWKKEGTKSRQKDKDFVNLAGQKEYAIADSKESYKKNAFDKK